MTMTTVTTVFLPVTLVLSAVAAVFAFVTHVFARITAIFALIPTAAFMLGIAHVFTFVAHIFASVMAVLFAVADILAVIADVFEAVKLARQVAVGACERGLGAEHSCKEAGDKKGLFHRFSGLKWVTAREPCYGFIRKGRANPCAENNML